MTHCVRDKMATYFSHILKELIAQENSSTLLQALLDISAGIERKSPEVEIKYGQKAKNQVEAQTQTTPRLQTLTERNDQLKKGEVSFETYLRYTEIQDYLHRLAFDYSECVQIKHYGLSYEERNLTLIHISTGGSTKKPIIFIDAGIHAREWLAPAQALYIINQLVENPINKYLIRNIDWIIIPLMNPDGYEYTFEVDRLWRKTRSKGKLHDGVDLNRNFGYHWRGPGSSRMESSNIYAGTAPFSEPETAAFRKIVHKYSHRIKLYLTIHAPALCLLYPWGHSLETPENVFELHDLGIKVAKAISAVNGTHYKVGSGGWLANSCSGCSRDWICGIKGIKLAYTLELPAYGNGDEKFEMPPEMILSVVQEAFEGIKVFHNHIEEKFVNS